MDTSKTSFVMAELTHVCPFPVRDREFFKVQIKSDDGRSTKWINITPDQFRQIEQVLLGVPVT